MEKIYLGRQPILDLKQRLFAYELLFRSGHTNSADVHDNVQATATVIVNAFNGLGIEAALGNCLGFINVDEDFLFSDVLELLPAHAVVLEILESVRPTPEVIARCTALQAAGYTLALDDLTQIHPDYTGLITLVEIIKVDVAQLDNSAIADIASRLKPLGKQLLAEKVESGEQMEFCRLHGFTLFQGYFFARPTVIAGKRLDYARLTLIRLLGMAISDADTSALEAELKREPALVVKLLRMINSVSAGTNTTIHSLRHAITLLGRRHLQRWLQLLIFASPGRSGSGSPLLMLAATRGRTMELLADRLEPDNTTFADQAFMAGVISLMPALFSTDIDTIITPLNLPVALQDALRHESGELGHLLQVARQCEDDGIGTAAPDNRISNLQLNQAHAQALAWANRLDADGAV